MHGRTSFVIAHRLSTIAGADWIVVVENGRIVEEGTHDDLMERSGKYRYMVDLQTRPPTPIEQTKQPFPPPVREAEPSAVASPPPAF
jgi:ABC-type transport system involved in cytochrome bd biosynthesis fused ATPase/permease subunit